MNITDLPARFPIPFANNAGGAYIRPIPQAHQTVVPGVDAPASLYDGFPPETMTPEGSGGIPPSGKDFNGILNAVTAVLQWMQAGGPATFDSTFSTAIGGYPKGAQLASTVTTGLIWVSSTNANTANPDVDATNWIALQPASASQSPLTVTINANGMAFGIPIGGTTYLFQMCKVNCSSSAATAFTWPVPFTSTVYPLPGGGQGLTFSGSYSAYCSGVGLTGGLAFGNNGAGAASTVTIYGVGF